MLVLEDANRIIASTLLEIQSVEREVEESFADFGDTQYHLLFSPKRDMIRLEVLLAAHSQLLSLGLIEHLCKYFGENVQLSCSDKASPGSFTVDVAKSKLNAQLIEKISLVRRAALSLPFELAFNAQEAGKSTQIMQLPLREKNKTGSGDVMFIQGHSDRVVVIIAMSFEDPSDIVLGKVFIQEFYDMRRQNSSLQNTPSILLDTKPPKDLSDVDGCVTADDINYITLE